MLDGSKTVAIRQQTQESQRPSFHTFIKNPIERHNSDKIPAAVRCAPCWTPASASKSSIQRFVILEKAPTRAFSWLKAATTAFTFETLLRHYAKWALTPRSLNVKLGPRRNYHKGRAAIRHYANQTARPL